MTLKVEVMIYAYLAVCVAMIIFNIVCIFVFRWQDRVLHRRSRRFGKTVEQQFEKGEISEKHMNYMKRKLRRIHNMTAFDETLEKLYSDNPERVREYISAINPVFVYLSFSYRKKDNLQKAYYSYIIKKYRVFEGKNDESVTGHLLELVKEPDLYCRENALQALYSIGNSGSIVSALKIIDRRNLFHHEKMITDGLLSFAGNRDELDNALWEAYPRFSLRIKRALLDYFRFSADKFPEKMFEIMKDKNENKELRFSAIRYFAKYRHPFALETLFEIALMDSPFWEYRAIASSALGNYPGKGTEEILKKLLSDTNWYVRYNASGSLERLGVRYYEMLDVFEGRDRYASEMLRYRFDRKKLGKQEEINV